MTKYSEQTPAVSDPEEPRTISLYVSTNGNDAWDGCQPEHSGESGPFATLTAAFDHLRQRRQRGAIPPGGATIYVRGGTYELAEPIVLRPEHGVPVTVRPFGREKAVFSGGEVITGWKETTIHAGKRAWITTIDEVAKGHWYFRSLFVNNERRERPRLPKKGMTRIVHVPGMPEENGWSDLGYNQFQLPPGEMKSFANLSDIDVMVFHFWICERLPVEHYDAATELITTRVKSRVPLVEAWGKTLAPCFLENVFEALTEPGEWYLSRESGELIYLPFENETLDNCTIVAPRTLQLLKMLGDTAKQKTVDWITFQDLEFRHTDWAQPNEPQVDQDTAWYDPERSIYTAGRRDRGAATQADCDLSGAVFLKGVRNCSFEGCTIANVGWYGVDLGDGCQGVALRGCELSDLGGGGVKLNGSAFADHKPHLETGHNRITDCRIHHGGRVFCAAVGIHCMHSHSNQFCHNDIHDFYYTGISIGWQWNFAPSVCRDNKVEFNHIHHLGFGRLSDMGGVYTLGIQSGTVIRNNHIHDIQAMNYGAWCIYPDEGSSHLLIENNVCHSTNREIFHQHYGRENIVRNNIFAFGDHGVVAYTTFVKPDMGFRLVKNILLARSEPHYVAGYSVALNDRGHESNFNLLHRYDGKGLKFSKKHGTTAEESEGVDFATWQTIGHDRQSVLEDPKCSDPDRGDFQLAADSPAIKFLGFEPIDLSSVGPRARAHWHDFAVPHWRAKS